MFRQAESPIRPDDICARQVRNGRLADRLSEGAVGTGVPPFRSGFPAFAARSNRVQSNGRKRRSCSPVRL